MKKSKLEKLREQMEEAKAKLRENQLKCCELAEEFRALQAEEKTDFLPGVRLLEISRRKAAIATEISGLKGQRRNLGRAQQDAETAFYAAERRLKGAQQTLDKIANPPAWGLGDCSQHQISIVERQAKKTIRELG